MNTVAAWKVTKSVDSRPIWFSTDELEFMADLNAEQLVQRASDLNLVDRRQMEEVWSELGSHDVGLSDLQRVMQGRGLLTNYQFDRLARGERAGFFYGNYKVLYLVGTGSFARVYRAVQIETGQVVALKVLRRRFSESPIQTEQFLREGRMGSQLRHPNIVPIYEVFSKNRVHFLVMEFVEGQNLRDFVRIRVKLSLAEAVHITTDITSGLNYAAERGITHRDLKLSNALISSSGRAQLVDFGLAAATAADGGDDELNNPRTIDYAGLEKLTNVPKDDPRSDIFFNGCMFYQMLSGVAPLSDTKDRLQRMNNSRFTNIKPIQEVAPELPGRVVLTVHKAMELDPNKRFQTQGEFLQELKMIQLRLKEGKLDREEVASISTETSSPPKTIMLVESSTEVQDLFRTKLKQEGYRVLVMRNPSLAVRRLEEPGVADCVIFSCLGLGSEGLEAFNYFSEHSIGKVPAILLLDQRQQSWETHAHVGDRHRILSMPMKMRQLRDAIQELVS